MGTGQTASVAMPLVLALVAEDNVALGLRHGSYGGGRSRELRISQR
jgi:hypothetical protein